MLRVSFVGDLSLVLGAVPPRDGPLSFFVGSLIIWTGK